MSATIPLALQPGARLGPYEILTLLGAGGMGEVYRATDTGLGRQVAIKVLPEAFAQDAERLARFEREAKILAALNHPHIAAIYGLEKTPDFTALVMELVEGDDLSQRIARGAIPLDEALPIARQIAEALEAAHNQGIVHRDLKPANVKVRADGTVKVLDFGLAKMLDAERTESSTITSPAMTQVGVLLGTAAYMSPEQTRGGVVDRRGDIWAFGCVLYEMLTGRRTFVGDDLSDTLVNIRKAEPNWSSLPPATPDAIRRLLRRCLAKDPRTRLPDIGSARLEIDDALTSPSAGEVPARTPLRSRWGLAAAIAALTALLAGAAVWIVMRPSAPATVTLAIVSDPNLTGASTSNWDVTISPDGQRILYLAGEGSALQLYTRPLDQLGATLLPAGNDVVNPFVSPDGAWVAFVDETAGTRLGVLKKMAVTGGPAVTILAPVINVRGASWSSDGTIVFATNQASGLLRVPADGGMAEPITATPESGTDYYYPEVLPGGRAVLFTIVRVNPAGPSRIAVLDLNTHEQKVLVEGGSNGRYASTGHLVYAAAGTLQAVPFDVSTLQVRGTAVPVVSGVVTKLSGAADFAIGTNGTLVYRTGVAFGTGSRTLVWVDRDGREEAVAAPARAYNRVTLSPDGSQLALDIRDQQDDIWIWSFTRQTLSRSTGDPLVDAGAVWMSDGRRIAFSKWSDNGNIYLQPADGSGQPERLTQRERRQMPNAVSPDGSVLIFSEPEIQPRDLWFVSLRGAGTPELLMGRTPFDEANGEVSPDGKWLAYESDESGQRQIYVRPFPDVTTGRWQVSTSGGSSPRWSRNGRELFFWAATSEATGQVMAAAMEPGPTFTSRPPRLVVARSYRSGGTGHSFDVSPDGQRLLMIKDAPATTSTSSQFVVVLNWTEELKRLVPTR